MYRLKPPKCPSSVGLDVQYVDLFLLIWKVHHVHSASSPSKAPGHNSEGRRPNVYTRPLPPAQARVELIKMHDL